MVDHLFIPREVADDLLTSKIPMAVSGVLDKIREPVLSSTLFIPAEILVSPFNKHPSIAHSVHSNTGGTYNCD